jgi:hypothetical protein
MCFNHKAILYDAANNLSPLSSRIIHMSNCKMLQYISQLLESSQQENIHAQILAVQ